MMKTAFCTKNAVLAPDLEKQLKLTQFYNKMMQNALCTKNVVLALDLNKL